MVVVFTSSLETLRAAFTEIKINKIMSAEQRRKDMKLLSAFLFVSCIYVLNAHGIGEKFIQLRFVFHDSLYLNITPLETLLVDDKFDCSFACVHNKLCISFNLAETSAEKLWCELLPSSIYKNTGEIVLNFKFDHYSIQVSSKPTIIDEA